MKPIIFPTIVLIMVATIGMSVASGQQYNDVSLQVDGKQIQMPVGNPALIYVPTDSQVYATIHLQEPDTISCTLINCVPNVKADMTFGAWQGVVSGTMSNNTAEIQTLNEQGTITYTILLMPKEQTIQQQQAKEQSWSMPEITNTDNNLVYVGVGFGVLVLIIYGAERWLHTRRIRRFR